MHSLVQTWVKLKLRVGYTHEVGSYLKVAVRRDGFGDQGQSLGGGSIWNVRTAKLTSPNEGYTNPLT